MATKKKPTESRRVKVEELRAQQKAAERKRTLLLVGIFAAVGVIMIGLALLPLIQNWREGDRELASYGVPADDAGCGEVVETPTTGASDHVEEGVRVEYDASPPSSGQHLYFTAGFDRQFYTRDDTPPLEQLVHNLEHGASVIWYDEEVSDEDVQDLEDLSDRLFEIDFKVIVAAWDSEDRGAFPEGHVAVSHWGADPATGYTQYCERPSGEVLADFIEAHPYTDSPEPNGG